MFPLCFHVLLDQGVFQIEFALIHLHLLLKSVINLPHSNATRFSPGIFALSIYIILFTCLYLILLVMFQINSNITLFVDMPRRFNPSLLMWNLHPSVCQRVNRIRLVFWHLHVLFFTKPLFTTVNLARPVTVYIAKSVNSPHHIRSVFPSVHCITSIHRHFSYRERENVNAFLRHH